MNSWLQHPETVNPQNVTPLNIGTGRQGWVPLYALNLPLRMNYPWSLPENIQKIKDTALAQGYPELMVDTFQWGPHSRFLSDKHNLAGAAKEWLEQLHAWVESPVKYEAKHEGINSYMRRLSDFRDFIKDNRAVGYYSSPSGIFYIRQGGLFSLEKHASWGVKMECQYTMVVPTDKVPLIRKAWLLGEKIPNNWFQMWVHPEFDTSNGKNSRWKSFRNLYRKEIKPNILHKEILIVEKEDIMNILFNQVEIPKFNSPKQYKAWLGELSEEFLKQEAAREEINRQSISSIKLPF